MIKLNTSTLPAAYQLFDSDCKSSTVRSKPWLANFFRQTQHYPYIHSGRKRAATLGGSRYLMQCFSTRETSWISIPTVARLLRYLGLGFPHAISQRIQRRLPALLFLQYHPSTATLIWVGTKPSCFALLFFSLAPPCPDVGSLATGVSAGRGNLGEIESETLLLKEAFIPRITHTQKSDR